MISQCGLCSRVAQRSALTTLTLLVCLLTLVSSSTAEQYKIHIQAQDGSPVEGAAIYGTDGVSYIAERFTDKNGDWPLDTRHIKSANPTIATSHHGQRYRMVPSEFRVSKEQCPGMVCTVTAMSDGPATAVVNWITTNYTGRVALPGMSIVVPYAHYPYPKISDSDGLVLFAVDAKSTACSNQNDDQSDDPYHIVPLGRPGENCSHTTRLTPQFQACPTVADYWGTMSSSCAATPQIDAANNINYEFAVRDLRNRPIPNVQFNLHVNGFTFSGGSVDSLGIWRFSTTQMGVTPQTRFSVIPARTDYDLSLIHI